MSIQQQTNRYDKGYSAAIDDMIEYLDKQEAGHRDDLKAAFLAGYIASRRRGRYYDTPKPIERSAAGSLFEKWYRGRQ